MTVTVKLITEQTTNQLVTSVNNAQTEGWFPVCGVVCFNARYTQLMAKDTERQGVAKCNYFIVDSDGALDFGKRVNELLVHNVGAVCLSSTQYVQARYIQAWGDDSLHNSGGGGATWPEFYAENTWGGGRPFPQIRTSNNSPWLNITSPNRHTDLIMSADYNGDQMGRLDFTISAGENHLQMLSPNYVLDNTDYRTFLKFGPKDDIDGKFEIDTTYYDGEEPHTIFNVNGMPVVQLGEQYQTLGLGYQNDGIRFWEGHEALIRAKNGLQVKHGQTDVITTSPTAIKLTLGKGSLTVSDNGGTLGYNNMLRMAWDANGWNVSHDTGVSFSSRATYSVMQAKSGARVETNATGTVIVSSDNPSTASSINMSTNAVKVKAGNTTLNMAAGGKVVISTEVNGAAPNLWLAQYTDGTGHNVAPGPDDPQQQYIIIGGREWGTDSVKGIGFGYEYSSSSWAPVFVGYRETDSGNQGKGDLFFSTRNVTPNTQPTERLRITAAGQITAAATYAPIADGDLVTKKYADSIAKSHGSTASSPVSKLYLNTVAPLVSQNTTSFGDVSGEDIAKMASLKPKLIDTPSGGFTLGYVYDDIIAAFGADVAELHGLAFVVDGVEVVNPTACLMMEALYVRSRAFAS